jgi:putative intracellular protease/amidase
VNANVEVAKNMSTKYIRGQHQHMRFLLESKLREKGRKFVSGEKWTDLSVRDGNLVTGQNPMSSSSTAEKVIDAIENPA